jgi:AraC-like DNA-binding protein
MLGELDPALPPEVLQVIVAATILGRSRVSVNVVARVCRISERTIERRLRGAGLPSVRSLLAGALVMRSVWNLEVRGEDVKHVAAKLRFESVATFSAFVRRQTGRTPRRLREKGSFLYLAEQFARASRSSPIHSRHRVAE